MSSFLISIVKMSDFWVIQKDTIKDALKDDDNKLKDGGSNPRTPGEDP